MTNYTCEYLKNNPQETKRLLGISYEQLEQLREYALFLNEQKEKEREKNKIRIHKAGGGRQAKISKEEQIILTLIYLRHYLSFQL